MKIEIEKLKKSAIKLTITIDTESINKTYQKILDEKVKTIKIEGFREGKATKKMAEEKLGPSNLYGDVINELLKSSYIQAISEKLIKPFSNPKIEIKDFDIEKDFIYTAEVAVEPEINLADLEDAKNELIKILQERNESLKKDNEEKAKKGEEIKIDHAHLNSNDVLKVLIEKSQLQIADVLLEEEVKNMLNQLMQQVKSIGLKFEDYLKAQQTTYENIENNYKLIAENNLKAEFILNKMIKEQNIEVEEKEIDQAFDVAGVSGVEQRKQDQTERAYVKNILQKNKIVTSLLEQVQGVHNHE